LNGIASRLEDIQKYLTAKQAVDHISNFDTFENYLKDGGNRSPIGPKIDLKELVKIERHSNFTSSTALVQSSSFKDYLNFLITNGEFPHHLLIMAEIYVKRAIDNPDTVNLIKPEGLKVFYGICVLLAYKFTEENDFWPLAEYCNFLGINAKTLFKYEIFVVCKIFNFKLHVNGHEIKKETEILINKCQQKILPKVNKQPKFMTFGSVKMQ
jgi:hypothetical protein